MIIAFVALMDGAESSAMNARKRLSAWMALRSLSATFRRYRARSLEARGGEAIAVMGANGAGKST